MFKFRNPFYFEKPSINVVPNPEYQKKEFLFTKDQVIGFARNVWYNESLQDTTRGVTDFFEQWEKSGCSLNSDVYESFKNKV